MSLIVIFFRHIVTVSEVIECTTWHFALMKDTFLFLIDIGEAGQCGCEYSRSERQHGTARQLDKVVQPLNGSVLDQRI